ncbi:MAG: FapA family protein [Lachnospiraceae bacterium]
MESKNGYFKLDIKEVGVFLQVYPPEEGGKPLEYKEVLSYLEERGYGKIDLKELNRVIALNEGMQEIYLDVWNGLQEDEQIIANISMDKMLVFCRFYPPSNNGKLLTEADIVNNLEAQKITVGINHEEIQKFLKERRYCTNYIMAKGIPPVNGKDAKIEYFFNINHNLKPKKNEDGTVNYHELNTISHVEQGQVLAKLHKEQPGKPGKDVFGGEIQARLAKSLKLEFGNNITISEDKTEIYSGVTGHASLVNGKVFVEDVFEVPADVDTSTGNIVYDGNVSIKGNVKSGFSVTAKGDIIIDGVVEAAFLSSGGQIIVKRGIHGMAKGRVQAKDNIISKFIENATVISGGYIEAGSILHSQVSAGSEIRVSGKKGFVNGGVIRAGNLVEAQTIGSSMGTLTKIEVGVDPQLKEHYGDLQKSIIQISKELEQMRPVLVNFNERMQRNEKLSPERIQQVQTVARSFKEKQQLLNMQRKELKEIHEQIQMSHNAKVKVTGSIYPGVSINISEVSMNIKSERTFSKFVKEQGEIVIRTL